MDRTLDYYNENAARFAAGTAELDFHEMQDRFLKHLPDGAAILDFGCGAGRDARYFASRGFTVTATDGSEELCRIAEQNSGLPVRQMLFGELEDVSVYDGVWACSSILHLPKAELADVLQRIARALKPGGWFYTSFKYGTHEGMRNGRWFTDFVESGFMEFITQIPDLTLAESWVTTDIRPGRDGERWLNLILQRH